jgi:hypothetical protein
MSGYDESRRLEAKGMNILMPFLHEKTDGHFVLLDRGPLAIALQATDGDAILHSRGRGAYSVEIKVENKFTGNLFLESWSNKNLDDLDNHVRVGSNPGWLLKLKSMLLFYYFMDGDRLYVINLFRLQRWAFGANGEKGNIYGYEEKKQGKYSQLNDTWGWCVPVGVIQREVGLKLVNPLQIPFSNIIDTSLIPEEID